MKHREMEDKLNSMQENAQIHRPRSTHLRCIVVEVLMTDVITRYERKKSLNTVRGKLFLS